MRVHESRFDVVIAAAPGIRGWPGRGARKLAKTLGEFGLSVGLAGGETLRPLGVVREIPSGATLVARDPQGRIHRWSARAVIRVSPVEDCEIPDPFPGSDTAGCVTLSTAWRWHGELRMRWTPSVAIYGSGNRAFRFASTLLEQGTREVWVIEPGTSPFDAWEVERRRFRMLGGRLLRAEPLSLKGLPSGFWELRLKDEHGIRLLEVARVVSAGPFSLRSFYRESPPGSFLFEFHQTPFQTGERDIRGVLEEETAAQLLAVRLIRSLVSEWSPQKRSRFERLQRAARFRARRLSPEPRQTWTPTFTGKWMDAGPAEELRRFSGVPRRLEREYPVASIECVESISCRICEKACPHSAISFTSQRDQVLKEDACTGCGICLDVCPSATPVLVSTPASGAFGKLVTSWRHRGRAVASGDGVQLLNRQGDFLANSRVRDFAAGVRPGVFRVTVDLPIHLVEEARAVSPLRKSSGALDPVESQREVDPLRSSEEFEREFRENRVEILFNGEKRLVREGIRLSAALFELGRGRPEDRLDCSDASCGRCAVKVDGRKTFACLQQVRRGMSVVPDSGVPERVAAMPSGNDPMLCPCAGISLAEATQLIERGRGSTCESLRELSGVAQGRCHGRSCREPFRRLLEKAGVQGAESWIDWNFPWVDWSFSFESEAD